LSALEGALIYPSAAKGGAACADGQPRPIDVIQQIAPESQFIHF
jgi:hypothetical protein